MATFLNSTPHLILSSVPDLSRNSNHLLFRTRSLPLFPHHKPSLRGASAVARVGFKPDLFPDPEFAEGVVRELLGRAESVLFTIADAAISSSDSVVETSKQSSDWFSGITASMESVLKVLKDGLSALHVPYSYGFAIILLTFIVKAATFPLTKKQVESAMAMRSLQPQIRAIQQRYAGDQERIQLESARLYKLARINPLAGCFPTLLTIPVWIGLYRALSNVANEGLLTEGFFWIPSLSGPATIGSGTSWLFPFVDGHPPLGWSETFAYLVLPVLLIVSQYISVQVMQSAQGNDPNMKNSQVITKFVPLLIGYFALSVPSGLSLYWFTNNMLSTAQQVWLQKLGGAKNPARDLGNIISMDDPSQIQKPALEKTLGEVDPGPGKKSTAEAGQRFKQIKEQEARRRREREEEEMEAAAAAASSIQMTNDGQKEESKLVETENGVTANLVDGVSERIESVASTSKSSNGVVNGGLPEQGSSNGVVKGDLSQHDSGEDQKRTSFIGLTNGTPPAEVEQGDAQYFRESLDKVDDVGKLTTTVTAMEGKPSSADGLRAKQEIHAENAE